MNYEGNSQQRERFSGAVQGAGVAAGKRRCMGCMKLYNINNSFCPYCGFAADSGAEKHTHLYPGTLLLGRYVVGKVIGCGGFGTTYLAWDNILQKERAIKEYLPSDLSTRAEGQTRITVFTGEKTRQFADGLAKFIDEAKKLAQFNSEEGIVKVYDSFEENNTAYIVMEYLDGETLSQYLARVGRIPVQQAINILFPVMESLDRVHSYGIIHRDIAPDNIFLTKDGQVKLIDFGAARIETSSYSRSLTVIVKPGYSAEEQYRSRGEQGRHSDVYSLGATLYKMVTGVTPPDALQRRAHIENKNKDLLEPVSKYIKDITANQETAIYNAMNVRIEDRTATVGGFADELTTKEKVKRKKGTIKKVDLYRWPLWAKIAVPALLTVIVVCGALFGTGVLSFPGSGVPAGKVSVPDVVTCSLLDAIKITEKNKLDIGVEYKIESEKYDENTVVFQEPEAGEIVDKGTKILVTICTGKGKDVVPDVVNYDGNTAKKKLERAGYKVRIKSGESSSAAPGVVINQSVKAGTELERGTEVVLTVNGSSGVSGVGGDVVVPGITGMSFDAASSMLAEKGIYLAINETVYDSAYSKNQIVKQSPAEGQIIKQGETVSVTVNAYTETVYTPNVVYRSMSDAVWLLQSRGFTVDIKYVNKNSIAENTVLAQNIPCGTHVPVGTLITIAVSKTRKAEVPDVVNMYYETAIEEITSRGISCEAYYKHSSTVEKDRIISQSVEPGTAIKAGTFIKIYISSGPEYVQPEVQRLPKPQTKQEIVNFYNDAVNKVKEDAVSIDRNYSKVVTNGSMKIPTAIFEVAENNLGGAEAFIKKQIEENSLGMATYKGMQIDANFPISGEDFASRLTVNDVSSATCTESGAYYIIKITTYPDEKTMNVDKELSHNAKAFDLVLPEDINRAVPEEIKEMLGEASVEYPAGTITVSVNAITGEVFEILYDSKWLVNFDNAGVTLPFGTKTGYRIHW
ncbi:MAG: PASTA domain-containing protein [Clostridia bacterium]|nr:PASTA domain-containing protein [Clostridia bacterium]